LIPEGLSVLTSYTFWVRLYGLYTFLSSGIALLGDFVSGYGMEREAILSSYALLKTGPDLVATCLALLLIWRADWVAVGLEHLGSSNRSDASDG
jgi:hypothetical protein